MLRTAQNVVRARLVFAAKKRRRYHDAQKHQQEQIQAFIFRHVRSISRIKVKGHFHLFIHSGGNPLRIRILFMFKPHQVRQMGTAFFIKSISVSFGDFQIVRRKAAFRIRHDFMQSRDQFRIGQYLAVPDILRKISIEIPVKRQIFLIGPQSCQHLFGRHFSRRGSLQLLL